MSPRSHIFDLASLSTRLWPLAALALLLVVFLWFLRPSYGHAQPPDDVAALKESLWLAEHSLPIDAADEQRSLRRGVLGDPTLTPWTRMAFQSYRDENWEIYLAAGDGSAPTRLTHDGAADTRPRLNRGADQLLFVSDRTGNSEIYLSALDGSPPTQLTHDPASDNYPAWSPDGSRVVFASNRDGNWELYLMNRDGSGLTRLTNHPYPDIMPSWSPDGTSLAWVQGIGNARGNLMMMTLNDGGSYTIGSYLLYLQHPVWSPDGTHILFDFDGTGDGWNDLGVARANGVGVEVLQAGDPWTDLWADSWSPDGAWLLTSRVHYRLEGNSLVIVGIYVEQFPATGGAPQLLMASGTDMLSDWQTMDSTPPQSAIHPLPRYIRSGTLHYMTWSATDTGLSGVAGYELQYRDAPYLPWTSFMKEIGLRSGISINGSPGATIPYRLRARDRAWNWESWPANDAGEVSTQFYAWDLTGMVTDNRGVGRPDVRLLMDPAPLDPAPTSATGQFANHIQEAMAVTVQAATQAGYGSSTQLQLGDSYTQRDEQAPLYLLPRDNVIVNGNFEEGGFFPIPGWGLEAPSSGRLTSYLRRSGRTLTLGPECEGVCLTEPYQLEPERYESYSLLVDHQERIHAFVNTPEGLRYHQRRADGSWLPGQVIAEVPYRAGFRNAMVDARDTLHLLWTSAAGHLHYAQRPANGPWSAPEVVTEREVGPLSLEVGPDGTVYILYRAPEIFGPDASPTTKPLFWRTRTPQGGWSAEQTIPTPPNLTTISFDLAVTSDGTFHLIRTLAVPTSFSSWPLNPFSLYQSSYRPESGWTAEQEILAAWRPETHANGNRLHLMIDAEGTLQLLLSLQGSGSLLHASQPRGGSWSEGRLLPHASGGYLLTQDPQGNLYLLSRYEGLSARFYLYRLVGQEWQESTPYFDHYGEEWEYAFDIDRQGFPHFLSIPRVAPGGVAYQTFQKATSHAPISASQMVTIPLSMPNPTLSFMYALGAPTLPEGALFEAKVDGTSVFSTTATGEWTLGWADLSAWGGQTVEVEFSAIRQVGNPYLSVLLDDISLGSWRTPLIHRLERSESEARTLVIHGENFVATPSVRLGGVALTGVTWVDAETLEVTLPSTLALGQHRLQVTNPVGQVSLPAFLQWGTPLYLPLTIGGR